MDLSNINKSLLEIPGFSIFDLFENDTYLFIRLLKGLSDEIFYHIIYNKKTKELKLLEENAFYNDIDGGVSFFPIQIERNGDMIGWKTAEEFKEEILSNDYTAQKAKYGERFERVYQLANSLQDDDNPILIIAKK